MKKSILSLLFLGSALFTTAQIPFPFRDSISVNHINASVLLHGDMWWDPATQTPKCEFPKGTGKHLGFVNSIWMSGYDAGSHLHVAAQTYRQDGNDYWPGPIEGSGPMTYTQSRDWARFWKIRYVDIQYFLGLSTHTVANTPPDILTWPAAGNTYATGNLGASLTIGATEHMAPFVDVNSNGIYEPLLGDYPDVKGDESLWWVFNDFGPLHTTTNGLPLGVEVHASSYAYNRGTLLDNVVYYEYTIINKSANNYHNMRLAQFSDADLGYYYDDFIGFDSARRMSIFYNGSADDGAAAGHPVNSYGIHSPVQGTTLIVLPGDAVTMSVPAGNFVYYNNDASPLGNPYADTEYNNLIRGKTRFGVQFTNTFAGYGIHDSFPLYGPPTRYVYTGDPSDTSQWSECSMVNMPGDRRTVMSSNDFALGAGASVKIVMALVVTDTNQGGCPNVNFHDIKVVADTAWTDYFNPPPPVPSGISAVSYSSDIKVYPLPATSQLNIDFTTNNRDGTLIFSNTLGQRLDLELQPTNTGKRVNISPLPPGIYYITYQSKNSTSSIKFVKQ